MNRIFTLLLALALTAGPAFGAEVTPGTLVGTFTGQQAVTATAAALPDRSGKVVCIKVLSAGTQEVYYGFSSAVTTSTGVELVAASGQGMCRPIQNANLIFVIAANTGSTVAYEVYR